VLDLFLAPGRYVQERGISKKIGEFVFSLGRKPLLLADRLVYSKIGKNILEELRAANLRSEFEEFRGECCTEEIERVASSAKKKGIDVFLGCGGGKALDTAKAASFHLHLPMVTLPTSAATCSAWSFIAPLYSKEGVYLKSPNLERTPNLALIDPEIIVQAPARLLSAGMADALAKWCEARISTQGIKKDLPTQLALGLSKKSYNLVKSIGVKAKRDVERRECSPELEQIIQINILLTGLIGGLGKGRCRSSAAHALNYAMTNFRETHGSLHGEKVAFGVTMMLILEKRSDEEIEELLRFYSLLDLPLTLERLGFIKNEKNLARLTEEMCKKESNIHRLPFSVDRRMVSEALLEADARGKKFEVKKAKEGSLEYSESIK